ncbi:phosphoribosylanthranilate isomerase [Marinithermus hydrothermalis]|uniref:N-(5'-phosphoribosyl)anthranilate isomerase n=1 Tax=Marinithermus hydrothermalis (strain DSM 14884 / JCM 11576 / T1) TaxID=869210 RepID=F2NLR0_MARHT|nr:phosphoribosylanthranilate isomerase [Marinithermus hydrothermalis]AEB10890.1 Phosphoribosylanthranilate isomerase [Marinithermus hydrothermalis DSM 14884]
MRVKICGITRLEDALEAERLGAWAVGFVFAPSKRRVTPEQAAAISRELGPFVRRVGVFVDTPPEEVLEVVRAARLDAVQLHGDEPPEWSEALRARLPVIKAVRLEGPPDPAVLEYPADALLVDGPRPGSGEAYDWAWLEPLARHPRLIVAGGLHPETLPRLLRRFRPYGVDVSSGVEVRPGVKDWGRMAAFLRAVRACG